MPELHLYEVIRRPIVTDRTKQLACDHVLLALGQSPELRLLPDGWEFKGPRAINGTLRQ